MGASNYPTSVWDGTSESRPDADVYRAPDAFDIAQLRNEILAIQNQLNPLYIGAAGVLRTVTGAGVDEVQTLAQIASTSGNWTLTFTIPGTVLPVTTASLSFDISNTELETAIDVAATAAEVVGWTNGDISVSGVADINAGDLVMTFDGTSVAKKVIAPCTTADVDLNDSTPPVVAETTPGWAPTGSPTTTMYNSSGTATIG